MKLKHLRVVLSILLGVMLILYLIGLARSEDGWYIAAVCLLGVATLLWLIWGRCPHCGALLHRQHGAYCQSCGRRLNDAEE